MSIFQDHTSSSFVDLTIREVAKAALFGSWLVLKENEVLNNHNAIKSFVQSR